MAPWEIWTYDFPTEGSHPCVIFSMKSGLRERREVVCKERRRLICQRMLQVLPFEF